MRRQRDGADGQIAVEEGARPDFLPVVVFGVDPEDRDGRDIVIARDLIGELQRRQRLEQREHGPAKQTGLLAGENRDRTRVRKLQPRFDRARWRGALLLLRGDDRRDLPAPTFVALRPRNRCGPRGPIGGIAAEERRDRWKIIGVIRRETTYPGKAADVDRNPQRGFAGQGSGSRRIVHVRPTVSKRSPNCQAAGRRYSLDATALRRASGAVRCIGSMLRCGPLSPEESFTAHGSSRLCARRLRSVSGSSSNWCGNVGSRVSRVRSRK